MVLHVIYNGSHRRLDRKRLSQWFRYEHTIIHLQVYYVRCERDYVGDYNK